MRDFDWDDVRFFLAVVRAGTISLAARRLGTEHTTVARRITRLEDALRTKLFDRRTNGYLLSGPGERFLPLAEAMENAATVAQGAIGESNLSLTGAVRIGAPDGFGSCFLAPRIGGLCRAHPGLEVQLIAMPRLFSLSKREADLAIGLAPPAEGRLVARKLTDYQLGLYAAPAYLEAAPPIRERADLLGHRFVGYIDDLIFAPELDYVPQVDRALRPQVKSSNLLAQMNATRAGVGICVLPCFMAADAALCPVLPEQILLTRSFWLLMHADQRDLARVRATADFISGEVQAAEALFLPHR